MLPKFDSFISFIIDPQRFSAGLEILIHTGYNSCWSNKFAGSWNSGDFPRWIQQVSVWHSLSYHCSRSKAESILRSSLLNESVEMTLNTFRLATSRRTYFIHADTYETMLEWKNIIQKNINWVKVAWLLAASECLGCNSCWIHRQHFICCPSKTSARKTRFGQSYLVKMTCKGFLLKQGEKGVVKDYKKRWFMLQGEYLYYFKDREVSLLSITSDFRNQSLWELFASVAALQSWSKGRRTHLNYIHLQGRIIFKLRLQWCYQSGQKRFRK